MNEADRFAAERPALAPAQSAMPRIVLSRRDEEILRACTAAVLGPLVPADRAACDRALEAGMTGVDDYLAHLSLPLQKEARFLLRALDLLPARLLLMGTARRWSAVSPERIAASLRRARSSRLRLLRRTHAFLQSMAVVAWFDLPAAWDEIGYPGPPIDRPAPPEAPS